MSDNGLAKNESAREKERQELLAEAMKNPGVAEFIRIFNRMRQCGYERPGNSRSHSSRPAGGPASPLKK